MTEETQEMLIGPLTQDQWLSLHGDRHYRRRLPQRARMTLTETEYAEYILRIVALAPPMTPETAQELRRILYGPLPLPATRKAR